MVDIGFIGLGHMGFPMARRLIDAGYDVIAFDTRTEALHGLVALGARPASSPKGVADVAETVMASLPSAHVALEVAAGAAGVVGGGQVRRYVDLSTIGSSTAVQIHDVLAERNIVGIDSPVSGGVGGAENGTLAMMVSAPRAEFDTLQPVLETLGRPMHVGEQPGSAQTMKLVNNILAATVLVATSEVVVMGAKSGLDPSVMIDVLNAGSGATSASRDKFPRAILPRTFDYGFATGLMVKDVRLYLDEARTLGCRSRSPRPSRDSGKPR
jgi:3-hydroxyisobutyrate dehydrogenase-like beta-hydroxyacid dehydrogenase